MISEYLSLALKSMNKRKLRTFLTLIGIVIAIATIFTLVAVSLGLQSAVEEQFRILGTDKIFVQARGQLAGPGTGGASQLTQNDIDAIEKINGVRETAFWVFSPLKVEFKDEIRFANAIGMDLEKADLYIETGNYKASEGRLLRSGDVSSIMIGSQYRVNNFLGNPVNSNEKLLINDKQFKVEGILEPIGNPQDDRLVYMPIDDFRNLFNISERIDMIIVQVDSTENPQELAGRIEKELDKSRNVDEDNRDFSILTPEELLESFGQILSIITAFLVAVAGISLLVGGVGIANTMYTSVLERTREIGTMKALGAKNSQVLSIFLVESGLLGLVGGILGLVLGYAISYTIEYIAVTQLSTNLLQVTTPFYLFAFCLAFAFIVGALSGIFPARQASKLKTVDALRYE